MLFADHFLAGVMQPPDKSVDSFLTARLGTVVQGIALNNYCSQEMID